MNDEARKSKDTNIVRDSLDQPYRRLDAGMGEAVARRTVLRPREDRPDRLEHWGDVAFRVARGNGSLAYTAHSEVAELEEAIALGKTLMSGRHLQHGDEHQGSRTLEPFSNCSTAATSYAQFLLLLSGSGVGRAYYDDLMLVDWDNAPRAVCVLSRQHPDYDARWTDPAELEGTLGVESLRWHTVEDSREGWAKVIEILESNAFLGTSETIVFDFSKVRPAGEPIKGMQNRPSSGPVPFMEAVVKMRRVVGRGFPKWLQAMWVDHYLAECVVVGGARRSARMAVKYWRDPDILDFVNIKQAADSHGDIMWSANNSVGVDHAFWTEALDPTSRAARILEAVVVAHRTHGSGEPGLINLDQLVFDERGLERLDAEFAGYSRYRPEPKARGLQNALLARFRQLPYKAIVNPCGEIVLSALGGYCTIADVVPFHCTSKQDALRTFQLVTRALMRVNRLPALYQEEVRRTNRIGVGITGVHEFAWTHFGYGFRDLIREYDALMQGDFSVHGGDFWEFLNTARQTVEDTATSYAHELGVEVPHTFTTAKPSGSVSKLFALTEGVHLPAMREYLRWVQFKDTDPLVAEYEAQGYLVQRGLQLYQGMALVGFPTQPLICRIVPDEHIVTATEATPEEQYQWLTLLEKYWIGPRGNQVSYTLKYDPERVTPDEYLALLHRWQARVRCCSVMPASDWRKTQQLYGYVPEEPITRAEYDMLVARVGGEGREDVDMESVQCASGACPI